MSLWEPPLNIKLPKVGVLYLEFMPRLWTLTHCIWDACISHRTWLTAQLSLVSFPDTTCEELVWWHLAHSLGSVKFIASCIYSWELTSAVSLCWSSQGFSVLHYGLCLLQCDWWIASYPGPAQLSVASSTEKRERAWYLFSREWRRDRKDGRKGLIVHRCTRPRTAKGAKVPGNLPYIPS